MTAASRFNLASEITGPDGTKYPLGEPTQDEQGQFAKWLEDRAHFAVDRGPESDARKAKSHERIYDKSGLGYYEWEGPLALEAMWTPAGLAKIVSILLRNRGVDLAKAEDICRHSFLEVAAKILVRATSDPKVRTQLVLRLSELGLPMDWITCGPSAPSSDSSPIPPGASPSPNSPGTATDNSYSSTTPESGAKAGS